MRRLDRRVLACSTGSYVDALGVAWPLRRVQDITHVLVLLLAQNDLTDVGEGGRSCCS